MAKDSVEARDRRKRYTIPRNRNRTVGEDREKELVQLVVRQSRAFVRFRSTGIKKATRAAGFNVTFSTSTYSIMSISESLYVSPASYLKKMTLIGV